MKLVQKPRVVIVGAGFGGLKAAQGLKRAPVDITLIDRRNHHLFQPLLYQVATASLSAINIAAPIRSILRKQKNISVVMEEVLHIQTDQKRVHLQNREIEYDFLILATGSSHSYFGKNEWEKFAPGLKSIADAVSIRDRLLSTFEKAQVEPSIEAQKKLLTFVLVGAGPTGVELAGAISDLIKHSMLQDFHQLHPNLVRIVLLEATPKVLPNFPDDLIRKAHRELEKLGVEIRTQAKVVNVTAHGVHLEDGEFIPSTSVIWTAGVQASPAGKWLKAAVDRAGRVIVNSELNLPEDPDIFVIGDTALVEGPDGKPLPGLAAVAMQEGRYVASVIEQRLSRKPDDEIRPFIYHDKGNLAILSRTSAVGDIRNHHVNGFFGWIAWAVVHIFYLIGFRNRTLVMIQWAFLYLTNQRAGRVIVSPERPSVNTIGIKTAKTTTSVKSA